MLIISLFLLGLQTTSIFSKQVCYPKFGCFTDSFPYRDFPYRPIRCLPENPEKIKTTFYLFNRLRNDKNFTITHESIPNDFDFKLPLKFVVHGFLDNFLSDWLFEIKDNILKIEDANIILVDWNNGNYFPYFRAAANTQIVGAEIAFLVNKLIENHGLDAKNVHIIGHSLGSHIAGYAGKRIKNLGRITGLDPAGPYFEYTEETVRLDRKDALFVDNIHTDGAHTIFGGFGMFQPIGHVDFYPNAGKDQPGCNFVKDRFGERSCSHGASLKFFIESIISIKCKFFGFKCNSMKEFDEGKCLNCSEIGCNQMGYWASPDKELGSLYLKTNPVTAPTFCVQNSIEKCKFEF